MPFLGQALVVVLLACSLVAPTGARRKSRPGKADSSTEPEGNEMSPTKESAVVLMRRLEQLAQQLHRQHVSQGDRVIGSVESEARSVSELSKLRLSELRQQCEEAGVSDEHVDDAMDSESPKWAIAELLFRATAQTTPTRTPADVVFAAGARYVLGGPGHTDHFDISREMLLRATAQHSAQQCLYYLLYNTEPKFGMPRALMHFVAPALAMADEELQLLCGHPMLLSLERTPLGQRILKNVPATDAEADERRLRADIYLSPSKLELSDKVMQAIRPGLGATAGPASGTQLPPLARADIIDAKWILFQAQQQEYILAHSNITDTEHEALTAAAAVNRAAADYLFVAEAGKRRAARKANAFLDPAARSQLNLPEIHSATFGRIVHRRPRSAIPGAGAQVALNPTVLERAHEIEQEYLSAGPPSDGSPNIVVVDDILSDAALEEIYRTCLEDTIWFDNRGGYLGAGARRGFYHPVLLQVADALRETFPNLFGPTDNLTQYWAYNYHQLDTEEVPKANVDDQLSPRIGIHSDPAAINLNIWLTPDSAASTPDDGSARGGLIVYKKTPPQTDDSNYKYNGAVSDSPQFRKQLIESGLLDDKVTVPYKRNRMVMFNSDLLHESDIGVFKDGFTNRRINLTFLFGVNRRTGGIEPSRSTFY